MKRIVLTCGLIAGAIVSVFMVLSIAYCYSTKQFEGSIVIGYAAMVLAFSMIFVGVKTYRDKYNNGVISFGNALKVGMYIALIASTMYVIVWLFDYYLFFPDFFEKFSQASLDKLAKDGSSATELAAKTKEMQQMGSLYKNPFFVILFTYLEILPVGLAVSLISAAILKRKNKTPEPAV